MKNCQSYAGNESGTYFCMFLCCSVTLISETRCSIINQFLLRVPYVLRYDGDQAVFPESSFCKFGNSTY